MIKQKSFKHGWFYHYRIHEKKSEELCQTNFHLLSDYLYQVFEKCPDTYFNSGPRGSKLRLNIETDLKKQDNHEICFLAKEGLNLKEYKTAHSNVQVFMLKFDNNTISVEVPIWLLHEEFEGYQEIFNDTKPLTGHIDVLQVKNEKIWVWDFKPNAHLEKYATTQTYFYAIMLSKRTGIPLNNFMCGYFDEKTAYTFNPLNVKVPIPLLSLNTVVTNL